MAGENNAFTFAVMSLLTQFIVGTLIATAQSGPYLQDYETAQNLAESQTNIIQNSTSSVQVNEGDVTGMKDTSSSLATFFEQMTNIPKYLGMLGNVIIKFGMSFFALYTFTGMMGEFFWLGICILGLWQIATLYYILSFILPRLKGG